LEVHHQTFRSHSGDDVAENLITACHECHSYLHLRRRRNQLGVSR
jgi:5-methylcytosine-specific restriction endonuclease McrA